MFGPIEVIEVWIKAMSKGTWVNLRRLGNEYLCAFKKGTAC